MGTIASIGVKPIGWREWLNEMLLALYRIVPRKPEVQLSVLKSVPVGQKANATLLAANGEQFLLVVTPNSATVVRKWTTECAELEVRGFVE